MQRPHVRQIEPQKIESEREITGSEAEELLRKYGYSEDQQLSSIKEPKNPKDNNLSFEEMVAQEEAKIKRERDIAYQKRHAHKPITFQNENGYDTKVTYETDEDTGFNFRIEISSDMKIPKY